MSDKIEELEAKIERLEERLDKIAKKLKMIEDILSENPVGQELILLILRALISQTDVDLYVLRRYRMLLKVYHILKKENIRDEISKAILQVLATRGPLNISQLTRYVRLLRGKASRRIIAERLRRLEEKGIVVKETKGRGKKYRIKDIL